MNKNIHIALLSGRRIVFGLGVSALLSLTLSGCALFGKAGCNTCPRFNMAPSQTVPADIKLVSEPLPAAQLPG